MASDSILSTNLEETEWVVQINGLLQRDDFHTAFESPTSIFQVPDSIRSESAEAFTPRRVALGPYHHFRPELLKLELYKLDGAKKVKHHIQLSEFHQLVSDKLKPLELKIRACFDKYLEVECETLSWIMLIDGLFLIRLIHIFAEVKVSCYYKRHELPLPELDAEHQQLYLNHEASLVGRDEIVCDALMVENQIPFRVLKEILAGNQMINDLPVQLYKFCVLVSPFGLPSHPPWISNCSSFLNLPHTFEQSHHLLQFLYLLISNQKEIEMGDRAGDALMSLLCICCKILGSLLQMGLEELLEDSNDLIQSLFEILKTLVQPSSFQDGFSTVPSATKLKKVGMKFQAAYSLRGITFDKKKASLHLPAITLDSTTQVILRNLVAFEVIAKLSPPCLSQYAAIMRGLIATTKDVKILMKAHIIINHLGSDEEVVDLFDEFGELASKSESSKTGSSSKSSKMVDMDEIIEKLNKYYEAKWRIKVAKFVKKYISPIAKILSILGVMLLIIFVIVRTFCGLLFSHCPRILNQ